MKNIKDYKLRMLFLAYSILFCCPYIFGQPICGTVRSKKEVKLYLFENNNLIDSANITKGKFVFRNILPNPSRLRLVTNEHKGYFDFIFAEPKVFIEVNGDSIWLSKVLNSKENDCYRKIRKAGKEYITQLNNSSDSIDIYRKLKDTISMKRSYQLNRQAWISIGQAWYNAISETITTFAALNSFQTSFNSYTPEIFTLDSMYSLYQKFPDKLKKTKTGRIVSQYFIVDSLLRKGEKIINFSAETPDGKSISVSSFKGKYLLIDYWASWCGPCRIEGKKILPLYQKYNTRGFEILGFSLDTDKKKWMDAIEEDRIPWHQISDLKGFYSDVVNIYNVNSIPFTILIDANGRIISKNIKSDELENELIKIFGK